MRVGLIATVVLIAISAPASAQVRGVCVSGCNIPQPPPQQQQQPGQDQQVLPNILVGVAAEVSGDVTLIYPNGTQVRPVPGGNTPIMYHTRVVTGPGARLRLVLLDESLFTIGPGGEMVIDEFVYDPRTDIRNVSLRILKGGFRFIGGKAESQNPETNKVQIAVGDLGFRGTDFEIVSEPWGSGYVDLHEGELQFREVDTDNLIFIHAGQKLVWEDFAFVGVQEGDQ